MKTEKTKKVISLIMVFVSVCIIITGIIFLLDYNKSHTGVSGNGTSRASTEITFGADYYTTMAQYTGLTANATADLYCIVRVGFGLLFLFGGIILLCFETQKICSLNNLEQVNENKVENLIPECDTEEI